MVVMIPSRILPSVHAGAESSVVYNGEVGIIVWDTGIRSDSRKRMFSLCRMLIIWLSMCQLLMEPVTRYECQAIRFVVND